MRRPHISIAVGLIRLYRIVFFWLPSQCRFEPRRSRYTEQAIRKHGLIGGSAMGARRIASCGPWHPGG